MDLLNETVLLKTKSTLFNLLISMTYVAYKNAFSAKCNSTVVSYQALFRLSVYKILAAYLSGAKNVCFCTIRDFGSPTINMQMVRKYTVKDFILVCHLTDRVNCIKD